MNAKHTVVTHLSVAAAALVSFAAWAEIPNTQWTFKNYNWALDEITEVVPEGRQPWIFHIRIGTGLVKGGGNDGVVQVGDSKALNFRTIPKDCTPIMILDGTFRGNTTIEEVYLPTSLVEIRTWTFYGASNLRVCDLPEDTLLETIGVKVFGDNKLTSFRFGSHLKTIGGEINGPNFSGDDKTFLGDKMPDSLETIGVENFYGSADAFVGRLTLGGDDTHGVVFTGRRVFAGCTKITEVVFGAGVTQPISTSYNGQEPFSGCSGITNIICRSPEGFTFGDTTVSYFGNLSGLRQYDLYGWPKGVMIANVTNGKQTRILAPRGNLTWLGYVADGSRVTPWGGISAADQNVYWTYFYGDGAEAAKAAAAAGEIPTPAGRVASAALYEGTSIPANVWIVFDKGEEIDGRTLIVAGEVDGIVPTTDQPEFLPTFGQTNFLAKTEGGESVSLVCTAPRFARVMPTAETTNYYEVVGWRILTRDANGDYATVAAEGQFAGDAPRQVVFDTSILTATNYKLVWRTSPLTADEFAFVPRLIPDQAFTGAPVEPQVGVETVVVEDDRVTMVQLDVESDYTLSYLDNTKIGTGKVIATGRGDYEGVAATNEFAIVSPDLGGMTLSGDFSDKNLLETEEAVIGDLALVDAFGAAIDPSSYEVRYLDNDKSGSATAYAVGKTGEFAGRTIAARSFNVLFFPVYRVTNAAQEGGSGKTWGDPMTYANALAALAATGGEIWIAGTVELTGSPDIQSFTKPLGVIRGGFAGVEEKSSARVEGAVSVIDGMGEYYPLRFTNTTKFELENLVIRRSKESGIVKTASGGDLALRKCRFIENLGADGLGKSARYTEGLGGAGASLNGSGIAVLTVENCDFSANKSNPRPGDIPKDWPDITDSAGLLANNFAAASIASSTFTNNYPHGNYLGGNRCGATGVAAYIYKTAVVSFSDCLFRGNRAVAPQGSIVDVSGGVSSAAFTNCLFVGNQVGGGAYAGDGFGIVRVLLNSANAPCVVKNCTVAYNLMHNKSAFVINAGKATVTDSIFFANLCALTDFPCDFSVSGVDATAHVGYSLFTSDSDLSLGEVSDGKLTETEGCCYGDPLFVTPVGDFTNAVKVTEIGHVAWVWPDFDTMNAFNVHLRGASGYFDETGALVRYKGNSPAVDTGDPQSAYQNEPSPNGHRVNLGAYGNTPQATMSPAGLMVIVQ